MKNIINLCIILFAGSANATVITMESGDRYTDHGFKKETGIHDILYADPYSGSGGTGYDAVLNSGQHVAFQHLDGSSISLISGDTWNFNGAYWASAYDDSNILTLNGYNGTTLLYSTTTELFTQSKQWIQSNFFGITHLSITTSANQAAWDDFVYNASSTAPPPEPTLIPEPTPIPEPVPLALLGAGLVGFGFYRKKPFNN